MLQLRRTFDNEKIQLQDLNARLQQYLSRVKQLEQENALLIKEINTIRQEKTVEWEKQYLPELREVRRAVDQLAFEKSKAEMEREKLRRELQNIQELCCQETVICRDIEGERKGYEKQLHHALKKNAALEERLLQLENEYRCLEDAHMQDISHLRNEVHSRPLPVIVTQKYQGHPAVTMEEMEEYALCLSEQWMENFEVYRCRVEDLEESIKADQAKLEELHREKMQYVAELQKLHAEADKQNEMQLQLEDQLRSMHDNCLLEFEQYQGIIAELDEERRLMAQAIAEKLKEHQQLMQVKMGLSLEVAAYRALLEGEGKDTFQKMDQNTRGTSRKIDIKMPAQPWSTPKRVEGWKQYPYSLRSETQHTDLASTLKASFESSQIRSTSPARVIPISVYGKDQQSSPARRDMPSFTRASQAATNIQKKTVEDKSIRPKEVPRQLGKASAPKYEPRISTSPDPGPPPAINKTSTVLPQSPKSTVIVNGQENVNQEFHEVETKDREDTDTNKVSMEESMTPDQEDERSDNSSEHVGLDEEEASSSDEKMVDYIFMEEIIEKVMRPAGLDTKLSTSPDSKVPYRVEKTEDEDGTKRTQIILESKVEEDLDITDDSALEELLNKEVKKISLEDIKGTPTGSVIQNLLTLGLQEGPTDLENKSVNVEIIEEIEELENNSHSGKLPESNTDTKKSTVTDDTEYTKEESVWVREGSRDADVPNSSHAQETEYFVSTPDDSISEPEEEFGISSSGHYGMVEDLSDERYYQEASPINPRYKEDIGYRSAPRTSYMTSEHVFSKDRFPECIIEEEVHVSPSVQESMLEILREDSMDPKQQLKGALEKLQGTVSGSLQEELSLLTESSEESPENLSVNVKKVQQVSDNGTVTITAELNVSQSLDDSNLLEAGASDKEMDVGSVASLPAEGGAQKFQGFSQDLGDVGPDSGEVRDAVYSYMQRMTVTKGHGDESTHSQGHESEARKWEGLAAEPVEFSQVMTTQFVDPQLKVIQEKKVATIYLETAMEE
ncbi:hypothetical protein AGOR_G00006420 [Albula goreensis]|uniref:IF rod domain-containing protein n=1 Tax=Albula goreensis TaxID=1534307 RepID=A0A8T3E5X3_9TELE|nr:hypothetical protein AGOR_G00006420 [Albula goreensis]